MRDRGSRLQISVKTSNHEELVQGYAFESVTENFTSVSLKKERRAKMMEKRVQLLENRKQREEEARKAEIELKV